MATELSLYLHIGHAKAGSSTVQAFLWQNWRALEALGIEQPSQHLGLSTTQDPPRNTLWTLKALAEQDTMAPVANWVEQVRQKRPHAHKLVLSSELLFNPGHAKLFAALSRAIPVHLIYYIRRQDELLLSAWRQWGLKRGLSLDELITRRIANGQPDFGAIIKEWQDALELASCHIRFIGRDFLVHGSLTDDFCAALGVPSGGLAPVEDQNVSLDGRLLHYMSRHPEFFTSPHDDTLLQLLNDPTATPVRAKLSVEQFERIAARFEPDNQRLLAKFQPHHAGRPVIERKTAPVFDADDGIGLEAQRAYIRAQLDRLRNHDDPRLDALHKTLENN